MSEEVTRWAAIIRDVGLIIGIPTIIVVGMKMCGLQLEALKHQNAPLKETQYDRALSALGLPAAPVPQQNSRYRMQKLPLSKRAMWRSLSLPLATNAIQESAKVLLLSTIADVEA